MENTPTHQHNFQPIHKLLKKASQLVGGLMPIPADTTTGHAVMQRPILQKELLECYS